jgi:glyoxylate/hydroxypyruvate reductase A
VARSGSERQDQPVIVVYEPADATSIANELLRLGVAGTPIPCHDTEALVEHLPAAEILIAGSFPLELLGLAKNLRWIQSLWAGVDTWLRPEVPPDIPITRMTGMFGNYMTEYVFAHLLSDTQRIHEFRELQEQREWRRLGTESLSARVLGLIGYGRIGKRVASMAKAFGLSVWVMRRDSVRRVEPPADRAFTQGELHEFLRGLDVLVLAVPATKETDGMIGKAEFDALSPNATVVNIGRGNVIVEDALVDALESGSIRRAVIDKFREEPLSPKSRLWSASRLTLTPHIAGPVYPAEVAAACRDNIEAFLQGVVPEPVLDRARGY